jgi:hypothetical protein
MALNGLKPHVVSCLKTANKRTFFLNRNLFTNLNVPIDFKRNYFERNFAMRSAIP